MDNYNFNVPIVDLNVNNFNVKSYRSLLEVINNASFCSIDFELSGLGLGQSSR